MIFTTLKAKIYAFVGAALGALLLIVKVQAHRISKYKGRAKNAEASNKHAREVVTKDAEVDHTTASHRAELINETRDNSIPSAFDPRKLRDKSDD